MTGEQKERLKDIVLNQTGRAYDVMGANEFQFDNGVASIKKSICSSER